MISVTSAMHVFGRLDLDDLNWRTRRHSKWAAYTQSKLANLLFINELARRGVRAYACDPGAVDTDIARDSTGLLHWLGQHKGVPFYLQSPAEGARSSVEAVTTNLPTGSYLAPRFKLWGKPKPAKPRETACDPVMARRLWELSTELTGCDWLAHTPQQVF